MITTVCPGCKDRPVASGHYMCEACEDRMASRPSKPPKTESSKATSARPPPREDRTYQDPLYANGVYHCPRCNAVLEAGTRRCGACGVQFMNPVPQAARASAGGSAPNGFPRPDAFCHNCGKTIGPDDAFCVTCGTSQGRADTGGSSSPNTKGGSDGSASGKRLGPSTSGQATPRQPQGRAASTPSPLSTPSNFGIWLWMGVILLVGGGVRVLVFQHASLGTLSNPFGPQPLATSLRQFQQGDSWEYRMSGSASLPGGRTGTISDGTLRETITSLEISNFNNLTETDEISLTFSDGTRTLPFSHSLQESLSQNLVGNTYLMSDNGGPQDNTRYVRQPQIDTPGVWSSGLNQSSHLDFDNGESRDETTTVQGSEVVDTALGKFTVWRCLQDESDSDGTRSTTTVWFAPQLGMPVKTTGTVTDPDGMVMTLNSDITKTTVPL